MNSNADKLRINTMRINSEQQATILSLFTCFLLKLTPDNILVCSCLIINSTGKVRKKNDDII